MINSINSQDKIFKYLQHSATTLKRKHLPVNSVELYKAEKLEGIQKGIPLFENVSMSQIFNLSTEAIEFVLKRGCANMCSHCYAKAMPEAHHRNNNKLTTIDFEDFEKLCNGFKELNKRLNFKLFGQERVKYVSLFHDGDASSIYLQDKNGNFYDYLDLAKKVHEITDAEILFDTSGWNIQDTKTQNRMEKLVQKAKNSSDYEFVTFNISINPFSPFYEKSLMYKSLNNKEKEEKFLNIYTDRLANTIFTMTPLFDNNRLEFIQRAFNKQDIEMEGYQIDDLKTLIGKIISKVKSKYINDFNSEQKVISSMEQYYKYVDILKTQTKEITTNLGITGRLASKIRTINPKSKILDKKNDAPINSCSIIDVNGQVYFTNFTNSIKKDLQLNYKNKNAETLQIYPEQLI